MVAVSCPATTLCVAVDNGGNEVVSTGPTGGAAAWKVVNVDGTTALSGISCPTTALCVAVDSLGDVITSIDPTGGASAWKTVDVDKSYGLTGISCPTTTLCVAVDQQGNVLTSSDATGGKGSWAAVVADGPHPPGFNAVSCAGTGLCVAGDDAGNLVTSFNPTGGASAWRLAAVDAPKGGSNEISAVTCASMQLCLAAASGSAGNLLFRATRPTAGVSAWQKTRGIADDAPLDALFCQSATLCIAQDVATDMVVTTDPTGVAVAWTLSMVQTPNHVTGGISSPTAQLCASVGGKDVVTSTHP
jgi:hypothetical protein